MADYPSRDAYFSHRFCRVLTKAAVAQDIGPDACWMLTVIVHQEDAKRYRGPVTYYNEQLMPLCSFGSHDRLIRARSRAIEAGWLHYEGGGKGRPGIYWCVIPDEFQTVPDGPMDEGLPRELRSQNTNETTKEQIFIPQDASASRAQTERNREPSYPIPNPDPKEEISASAEICTEPGEPAPSRPAEEPTEFVFECVGKGAKSWTLTKSKLDEYLEAYPDLDVRREIRKARQWIRDNPAKKKTANGMPKFLSGWLSRAQNSGGGSYGGNRFNGRHGTKNGPGQSYDPNHEGGGIF